MAKQRTRATSGEDTVEILYDEGNLSHIWVVDRRQSPPGYIKCPSLHPEYFDGLARWQDDQIRAALVAAGMPPTRENLVTMKRELFFRAQPENRKRGKKKVDHQAAKFQAPTAPLHGALPGAAPSAVASRARSGRPRGAPAAVRPEAASPPDLVTIPGSVRRDLYDVE